MKQFLIALLFVCGVQVAELHAWPAGRSAAKDKVDLLAGKRVMGLGCQAGSKPVNEASGLPGRQVLWYDSPARDGET